MPKILVLVAGQPTAMADAVADGARSVRFSEVEIRRVDQLTSGTPSDSHQTLGGLDEIASYDGIVIAASEGGAIPPETARLLDAAAARSRSAWQNKVGSAFMASAGEARLDVWPALATLGDLGMVVVAPSGA